MPGANTYETPWLDAPTDPSVGIFQYYFFVLNVHLHLDIRWQFGVISHSDLAMSDIDYSILQLINWLTN